MGSENNPISDRGGAETPQSSTAAAVPAHRSGAAPAPVLAVVKDLFFVARIRETARLAGIPLTFARTTAEIHAGLAARPRFVLLDLTGSFDYEDLFEAVAPTAVPVLAFTTHALARQTQPWHARCARVVTKETLTAELPVLLRDGVSA